MSQWMGIILKRETVPDDLVPEEEGYGNGQDIPDAVEALSAFCERAGLTRLDHFIVDHCALVERALKSAGWVEPDVTDPEYLASQKRYAQIVEEVEKGKPWFDPGDGRRTIRGLIEMAEKGIPLDWWRDATNKLRQRLLEAGVGTDHVDLLYPQPVGDYQAPLWDLRTFELELEFAIRVGEVFHFAISY